MDTDLSSSPTGSTSSNTSSNTQETLEIVVNRSTLDDILTNLKPGEKKNCFLIYAANWFKTIENLIIKHEQINTSKYFSCNFFI